VKEAAQMLPQTASLDEIAARAIRCNVFHTMKSILKYSDLLREKVNDGSVQIHGAIYDITTGKVEFLGPLPMSEARGGA
jgi:carbonic anhydrase